MFPELKILYLNIPFVETRFVSKKTQIKYKSILPDKNYLLPKNFTIFNEFIVKIALGLKS